MPFEVLFWITVALCAIVVAEIVSAAILYSKLCKAKSRPRTGKTLAFLGILNTSVYMIPLWICAALLLIEAALLLWINISFYQMLKNATADEKADAAAKKKAAEEKAREEARREKEEAERRKKEAEERRKKLAAERRAKLEEEHRLREEAEEEAKRLVRETITIAEAHNAISDETALHLIEEDEKYEKILATASSADDAAVATYLKMMEGGKRYEQKTIINVDTLSENFEAEAHVNLETLKAKKLIPANADFVKVLGRGILDKHLYVEAQDFSADAVKMIVLTGGHAIHKA